MISVETMTPFYDLPPADQDALKKIAVTRIEVRYSPKFPSAESLPKGAHRDQREGADCWLVRIDGEPAGEIIPTSEAVAYVPNTYGRVRGFHSFERFTTADVKDGLATFLAGMTFKREAEAAKRAG